MVGIGDVGASYGEVEKVDVQPEQREGHEEELEEGARG